jgi:hypothetical protein
MKSLLHLAAIERAAGTGAGANPELGNAALNKQRRQPAAQPAGRLAFARRCAGAGAAGAGDEEPGERAGAA